MKTEELIKKLKDDIAELKRIVKALQALSDENIENDNKPKSIN